MNPDVVEEIARRVAEVLAERQPTRLIDAAAAAEQLAVPESWIRSEARAGCLPSIPLGRYVRFDPAALDLWWREQASQPRRAA